MAKVRDLGRLRGRILGKGAVAVAAGDPWRLRAAGRKVQCSLRTRILQYHPAEKHDP